MEKDDVSKKRGGLKALKGSDLIRPDFLLPPTDMQRVWGLAAAKDGHAQSRQKCLKEWAAAKMGEGIQLSSLPGKEREKKRCLSSKYPFFCSFKWGRLKFLTVRRLRADFCLSHRNSGKCSVPRPGIGFDTRERVRFFSSLPRLSRDRVVQAALDQVGQVRVDRLSVLGPIQSGRHLPVAAPLLSSLLVSSGQPRLFHTSPPPPPKSSNFSPSSARTHP